MLKSTIIKKIFFEKLLYILSTLLFLSIFTFVLMKAIPGDPFSDEQGLPKQLLQSLREHYQLDRSLPIQFINYFKELMQGNLGLSLAYKGRSVNAIIREGFPISATLGLEALFFSCSFGIFFGTLAAMWHRRYFDAALITFVTLGISVPSFILATLLQYIFAINLHWFPVARWGTLAHTILPALSLAAMPTAFIARMTRTNMLEVMRQNFITTARAKGLPEWQIAIKHCLRNALLPLIPYLGQLSANVLTGSFVVENIFAIPGLGQWLVRAVSFRDYPVIMGINLFYGLILLLTMTGVDILTLCLNPMHRANYLKNKPILSG